MNVLTYIIVLKTRGRLNRVGLRSIDQLESVIPARIRRKSSCKAAAEWIQVSDDKADHVEHLNKVNLSRHTVEEWLVLLPYSKTEFDPGWSLFIEFPCSACSSLKWTLDLSVMNTLATHSKMLTLHSDGPLTSTTSQKMCNVHLTTADLCGCLHVSMSRSFLLFCLWPGISASVLFLLFMIPTSVPLLPFLNLFTSVLLFSLSLSPVLSPSG